MNIASDIDWHQIARQYEITGAGILNVAHYCAIEALSDESLLLDMSRLEKAIKREYVKDGKVV
jgi:ATP-dependent 26S proteasome regulatory subunit